MTQITFPTLRLVDDDTAAAIALLEMRYKVALGDPLGIRPLGADDVQAISILGAAALHLAQGHAV